MNPLDKGHKFIIWKIAYSTFLNNFLWLKDNKFQDFFLLSQTLSDTSPTSLYFYPK